MDNNRYEEVPQKQNKVAGAFKAFGHYLKYVFIDFINSFKYNNMKLPGLFIIIPGALFGFFLSFHYNTIVHMVFLNTVGQPYNGVVDFSGFVLFAMMLVGILNIFLGFSLMNKKNLGSVILATVSTVIITALAGAYIFLIMTYKNGTDVYVNKLEELVNSGLTADAAKAQLAAEAFNGIPANTRFAFGVNEIMSLFAVALCVVSSIAGVIIGYIRYDRTYEKSKDRR